MVYCTKCGAKNEEDAAICVKCGATLVAQPPWRREHWRPAEEECFGLPHGGAIIGLIFGIIIILVGLSMLPGIEIGKYIGAVLVIIFGILILAGALYRYSRRR
jgi:uncharacterized membrane protein YidH (DUF202 family)